MKVNFLLTGEGTSDLMLQTHLEKMLIAVGFTEVYGQAPDISQLAPRAGRTVRDKLTVLMRCFPQTDVIFYHRDADGAGLRARQDEIAAGAVGVIGTRVLIPLVPVRELETWLLADHKAIKTTAGNNNDAFRIGCLPALRHLENTADAKALLMEALCEASETQGGKRKKFKKRFSEMRGRLAMDLDPLGPISELPSYQVFRASVELFARAKLAQL